MQSSPDMEVSERFLYSFGAWTWLAKMLGAVEFLQLQALNRYTYSISISRVQTIWLLPEKPLYALGHFPLYKESYLFLHDDQSQHDNWLLANAKKLDFFSTKSCIAVGQTLITFIGHKQQRIQVRRYDNIINSREMTKTDLAPLPNNKAWTGFALCTFKSRFVLFSGGLCSSQQSSGVLLLDVQTGEWVKKPAQPCMNHMRYGHSSCANDKFSVVFGGNEHYKLINSLELLQHEEDSQQEG